MYRKEKYFFRPQRLSEFFFSLREYSNLLKQRLEFVVRVEQPLVLISQVQRSGGTLLSQLFDNHPQVHAHPHELYIGFPYKYHWPALDLNGRPEAWFDLLFEKYTSYFFYHGYKKYPKGIDYKNPDDFPFLLPPSYQRRIFLQEIRRTDVKSQRDVINCYMTSYFNAWLDYRELYRPKKYIAAFTPRVNMYPDSTERFFQDYPDGRMISLIRQPKSWYASIRKQVPDKYGDVKKTLPLWKRSAEGMLRNKKSYGDKVFLMNFESLVQDTEGNMRALAEYLGLEFDETLLEPTFQGMPIRANAYEVIKNYGVISKPLERGRELDEEDASYIEGETEALFKSVLDELDYFS